MSELNGYGTTIGKCLTDGEIEALLAAERERCAKVADREARDWPQKWTAATATRAVAAAIRNLPPQTAGGQP